MKTTQIDNPTPKQFAASLERVLGTDNIILSRKHYQLLTKYSDRRTYGRRIKVKFHHPSVTRDVLDQIKADLKLSNDWSVRTCVYDTSIKRLTYLSLVKHFKN